MAVYLYSICPLPTILYAHIPFRRRRNYCGKEEPEQSAGNNDNARELQSSAVQTTGLTGSRESLLNSQNARQHVGTPRRILRYASHTSPVHDACLYREPSATLKRRTFMASSWKRLRTVLARRCKFHWIDENLRKPNVEVMRSGEYTQNCGWNCAGG
ncbi:hypothetical protein KM043_016594 [Ampulex compressa]|nr:hypothetical protein KM043_016594 [Ampulex compressa]